MQRSGRMMVSAAALLALAGGSRADVVTVPAVRDNTLYEPGNLSNGAGVYFFCGRTAMGSRRRAVLAFDLTAIPAGSTINTVELRLRMVQTISGVHNCSIHRLLADWGEGASNATAGGGGSGAPPQPGDATWTLRFHPDPLTAWATAGGHFVAAASATSPVGAQSTYTWGSTAMMVADVQGWVDDPASRFGWLLRGNEVAFPTAKSFASRQFADPGQRPMLTIDFTPPPPVCDADLDGSGAVGFSDLNLLLEEWGPCPACPEDLDGSGVVGFADLNILLAEWGPCR